MPNYSGKYVIMLDTWLEVYPDQWPISTSRSTLEAIRKVGQVEDGTHTVPRSSYTAELLENKSVINSQTGKLMKGGIYKLS